MNVKKTSIHPRLQSRIEVTPEIRNIKTENYTFYEFHDNGFPYFGFVGYWKIKDEGISYAFIAIKSYILGKGREMMEYVIPLLEEEVDWLLWITDQTNVKSIKLAKNLGFSQEAYQRFKEKINNSAIREDLLVFSLELNRRLL